MTKKTLIPIILLVLVLSGCGGADTRMAEPSTPVALPSASATNTAEELAKETPPPKPTATIRLAKITKTPQTHWYIPTMARPTPTPTYGPLDTVIDWRLPDWLEIRNTSFIDAEQGWAIFNETLLFQTKDGGATWSELPQLKQPFRELEFVSPSLGWGVASDGLYKTVDGGRIWSRVLDNSGPVAPVIDFVDENNGFLYSAASIRRTSDGGKTWQETHLQPFAGLDVEFWSLSSISFINAREGWALLRACIAPFCQMKLFKTEDGGETFDLVSESGMRKNNVDSLNTNRPGDEIFFLDEKHGWFVGSQYHFQWTEDGGKTWKRQGLPRYLFEIFHIHMFTVLEGIAADWDEYNGHYRGVLKTYDGGKTWEPLIPSLQPDDFIWFQDADHGFGTGGFLDPTAMLATENGGKSWKQFAQLPEPAARVQFLDQQTVYAGGSSFRDKPGYLWRTKDRGSTWEKIHLLEGFGVEDFFFSSAEIGIAWDGKGSSIQTQDQGKTWQKLEADAFNIPLPDKKCGWLQMDATIYHACPGSQSWSPVLSLGGIHRFLPVSETAAWVYGNETDGKVRVLLRTTDGGKTWEPYKTGRAFFGDISFIDLNQGWAVDGPFLLRTTDGANTWQQVLPDMLTLE